MASEAVVRAPEGDLDTFLPNIPATNMCEAGPRGTEMNQTQSGPSRRCHYPEGLTGRKRDSIEEKYRKLRGNTGLVKVKEGMSGTPSEKR